MCGVRIAGDRNQFFDCFFLHCVYRPHRHSLICNVLERFVPVLHSQIPLTIYSAHRDRMAKFLRHDKDDRAKGEPYPCAPALPAHLTRSSRFGACHICGLCLRKGAPRLRIRSSFRFLYLKKVPIMDIVNVTNSFSQKRRNVSTNTRKLIKKAAQNRQNVGVFNTRCVQ